MTGWTFGVHDDVSVDGQEVPTIGLSPGRGARIAPTITDGRAARQPREIMLGATTLNQMHRRVGQTITVRFQVFCCADAAPKAPPATPMRIVGRGVFPFFGEGSFTPTGLGVGAQVAVPPVGAANPEGFANFVLVRVAAGPQHEARVMRLVRDLGRAHICGPFNQCSISTASRPADILNYSRVQSTPVRAVDRACVARYRRCHQSPRQLDPPTPTRYRGSQDPRLRPATGVDSGRFAGDDGCRGRARCRAADRQHARALGLVDLRDELGNHGGRPNSDRPRSSP